MDHVDDFLAHHGVKGMKWGVRRALRNTPASGRAAFIASKDAKWQAKVNANPKIGKISRMAARDAKRQTKHLKADYKARGLNVKSPGLAQTRYDTELKQILEHSVERAAHRVHKLSPSRLNEVAIHRHPDGTLSAVIVPRTNAKLSKQLGKIAKADAKAAKVAHADTTGDVTEEMLVGLEFHFILDAEGFVDDIVTPYDVVAHDDLEEAGEDFIAHYGVKGMHWGVRRGRSSGVSVSRHPARAGQVSPAHKNPDILKNHAIMGSKVGKGKKHEPAMSSEDAIVFHALKAKAKKGGIHSLTNDEIRVLTSRAELMSKYNKTFPADRTRKAKAAEFIIQDVLIGTGKQMLKEVAGHHARTYLGKKGHLAAKGKADS